MPAACRRPTTRSDTIASLRIYDKAGPLDARAARGAVSSLISCLAMFQLFGPTMIIRSLPGFAIAWPNRFGESGWNGTSWDIIPPSASLLGP